MIPLPDDVIAAEKPCLQQMIEAYEADRRKHGRRDGSAAREDEVLRHPRLRGGHGLSRQRSRAWSKKPEPDTAPSNLAVIGRYILAPTVMKNLSRVKEGSGGEIQLTDAIAMEIAEERGVYGFRFRGQRFDCGSKAGFLQATVAYGLARDDLRDELQQYLDELAMTRNAAQ